MRQLLLFLFCGLFISACSGPATDPELYSWRWEGLMEASTSTRLHLEAIGYSFEEKARGPATSLKATHWLERKLQVDLICRRAIGHLDTLLMRARKKQPFKTVDWHALAKEKSSHILSSSERMILRELMTKTFNEAVAVDSIVYDAFAEFQEQGRNRRAFASKLRVPEGAWVNAAEAQLAVLQLRYEVSQLNLRLATLFHEQSSTVVLRCMDFDRPIVSQSSEWIRPGGRLRIEAAMGRISIASQPKFLFNGRRVSVNEAGMAVWIQTAPKTPGTYSVPVSIQFADQDGKVQTMTKEVKYRVVACPDTFPH